MEQQLSCPNCGASEVQSKTVTVDRRTGKRVNKVVSLVAAIGLLSFGGCMLLGGIFVAISTEMIEALWVYVGFGALFLVPGGIVLFRYLRVDKTTLTEHTCASCQHTWKEIAGGEAVTEGDQEIASPSTEISTLAGWQPGILGGQPVNVQIELAPEWMLVTIPGNKLRISKQDAATKVGFQSTPYSGKEKTAHLDGLPVVHLENIKNIILEQEAHEQLRAWVPEATVQDRLKKELRSWGGSLIFAGLASFAYAGTLNPVWGGMLILLGILNLIISHRVMFIFNGIGLLIAALMNLLGGGIWIALGILQVVWAIAEFRKFAQYAE